MADIGIIGGSGLYALAGLEVLQELEVATPFGAPSSSITLGRLDGVELAFVARHGRGHTIPPHLVPNRANLWALASLGVERVIAVNAVGSLTERLAPGELAVPDDLFDRTWGREHTFFATGLVAHVDVAAPFCGGVRQALISAGLELDFPVHAAGTLVVIQGPRFSTRAESHFHRAAGFELVGMTTLPEATLAREAGLCYATLCLVSDFDVWHSSEDPVTVEVVLENLRLGVERAKVTLRSALPRLTAMGNCACGRALDSAIATGPRHRDLQLLDSLRPFLPDIDAP